MSKEKYIPAREMVDLSPADCVRVACELKELSRAEIARMAGLHPSHLSEIVHGKRPIGATVAKRLSRALSIPISMLLGGDEIAAIRRREVESALRRAMKHIKESKSMGEKTEQLLLKDIEDALEANRKAS
jgi:transcriptional regulator with XRE-family HTH domain